MLEKVKRRTLLVVLVLLVADVLDRVLVAMSGVIGYPATFLVSLMAFGVYVLAVRAYYGRRL